MPLVSQIVDRALEHLRIKQTGQTTSAENADLGLRATSSLLDLWQLDPQLAIGLTELTFTPDPGAQSFTIGASGDIEATMPVSLDPSTFVRDGNVDRQVVIADSMEQYTAQPLKDTQGPLTLVYLQRGNDGVATVYMSPAATGSEELHLWVRQDVVDGYDALALTTNLTLPNGVRNTLEWCLAAEMAPDFPGADPRVEQRAANALRKLKRSNFKSLQINTGLGSRPSGISIVGSSDDGIVDGGTP
jgi:hypothetical protein